MVAFTVVWTTIFGIGHFGDPGLPIADRILEAQVVIMVVTVGSSVLAALFAERRQREADLVASEARLRMAQTSTGVGIWDWDVRSGAISWTRELEEIYGLETESVKAYSDFHDRVHPDDIENLEACREAAIRKNERYRHEFRIIRPSGEVRWVATTGSASYDPNTGEPIRLMGNNIDITERKRAEEHQKTLMAELDHRVKNVLARVAMLVASTRKESTTIDKYVSSLQGRIQSMAVAHSLLSQSGWQNVELGALVRKQLAPYARGSNLTIEGEDIIIGPNTIQALAMVLHELVTNAAKYGSLSVPDGRVCVTWDRQNLDEGVKLLLQWRELDGPPVAVNAPSGYGTSLIRGLIPHELGGTVDLVFAPEGVNCKIEILLERE
jgi:PAS domain S-box-containing protein